MSGPQPTLNYATPLAEERQRPSMMIWAGIVGFSTGITFGMCTFNLWIRIVLWPASSTVIVADDQNLPRLMRSFFLINGAAGTVIALAGLIWSRGRSRIEPIANSLAFAVVYVILVGAFSRIYRPPSPPLFLNALSQNVLPPPSSIPLDQVPALSPPVLGTVLVVCLLLHGIGASRRAR